MDTPSAADRAVVPAPARVLEALSASATLGIVISAMTWMLLAAIRRRMSPAVTPINSWARRLLNAS